MGFTLNCNQSTEDAYGQGPFYTANAPSIQNNQLADINEVGTRIIISGQVYNLECSEVIPNIKKLTFGSTMQENMITLDII